MKNKKKILKPRPFLQIIRTLSMLALAGSTMSTQGATISLGLGSYADQPNPDGFTCTYDYGNWIHNAGVVEPGIAGCDTATGTPIGSPTPLLPQVTGPADSGLTGTHRWWGSVSFYGTMTIDSPNRAGYITPDPIAARLSERGFRMINIPGGLAFKNGNSDIYEIPAPFNEVFDGLAIANSSYNQMEVKLYDYSDGSMTAEWQQDDQAIMRTTFVHGSPYAFVHVLQGELVLKTFAANGPEKGVYHQSDNQLGIWTQVAGNRGTFLVVGEGETEFSNVDSASIQVENASGKFAVALLPVGESLPSAELINRFAQYASQPIDEVQVDYNVSASTQSVTISQSYLHEGAPVTTMAGLLPLQWKNAVQTVDSSDQIRSARGYTKFSPQSTFSYELPFVGVLPTLPAQTDNYDVDKLTELIQEFIAQGEANWNDKTDTYWSGKNYGKVAELAALAHQHGLTTEHSALVNWLKSELEDWFTAETDGSPDETKYFSYDSEWNTLLGYDESFGAQQQLNDHHFHYGYFVRAAAEICRVDKSWCSEDAWGGMVEMLIRDYAANRDDPLFPYTRNFDPAYGFSWASGHANFVLGNNNESTSEAANAYGAIILYGLITGNEALTNHGIYLHSSSTATYWEYWNNIDRYRGKPAPYDNFSPDYDKLTTSIIWGNGHVFSTWFSGAYAHILGIQGLPLNPLVMHIGQHADYLKEYVQLGLSESSNGKPSGLVNDQWRDVWWNIWSMTEPEAAIEDFNTMDFDYDIEAGESMAHTYHWIHSFNKFGHLKSGDGSITADSPAALVFDKDGTLTYLTYNFDDTAQVITFSDGATITTQPNSFGQLVQEAEPDLEAPTQPGEITVTQVLPTSVTLQWQAASDNVRVEAYDITVTGDITQSLSSTVPMIVISGLTAETDYTVEVIARDPSDNESPVRMGTFTTANQEDDTVPSSPTNIRADQIFNTWALIAWNSSLDDNGVESYQIQLYQGGELQGVFNEESTQVSLTDLDSETQYEVHVSAIDTIGQNSPVSAFTFTTMPAIPACADYCIFEQNTALVFTVAIGTYVDLHYSVNGGGQQNVRMFNVSNEHVYSVGNLSDGDVIEYSYTVFDGTAFGTNQEQHIFGAVDSAPDPDPDTSPTEEPDVEVNPSPEEVEDEKGKAGSFSLLLVFALSIGLGVMRRRV